MILEKDYVSKRPIIATWFVFLKHENGDEISNFDFKNVLEKVKKLIKEKEKEKNVDLKIIDRNNKTLIGVAKRNHSLLFKDLSLLNKSFYTIEIPKEENVDFKVDIAFELAPISSEDYDEREEEYEHALSHAVLSEYQEDEIQHDIDNFVLNGSGEVYINNVLLYFKWNARKCI